MSDLMLYGVLRMPYGMAMESDISRIQFYGRVQQCADRCEAAEALVAAQIATIDTLTRERDAAQAAAPVAAMPTIKQLAAQLDSDEKWTIAEQKAFASFLAQFPNECSQGIISLGSAWKHGIAYAQSLAAPLHPLPVEQGAAPQQQAQPLPKWIDDAKGRDPFTDDLIAYIEGHPVQQQAQAAQPEVNAALDRADTEDAARFDAQAAQFPPRNASKPAEQQGIFEKFRVQRMDGSDAPGGKHHGCKYFVLDLDHDIHAGMAMRAYAKSCRTTHPILADDIEDAWGRFENDPALTGNAQAALSDDLNLIRACVEGYPASPARNTALATIRKILATRQAAPVAAAAQGDAAPIYKEITDRKGKITGYVMTNADRMPNYTQPHIERDAQDSERRRPQQIKDYHHEQRKT